MNYETKDKYPINHDDDDDDDDHFDDHDDVDDGRIKIQCRW